MVSNMLVNIVGNGRTDAPAGAAILRLHHHHNGVTRVLIGRKRSEPIIPAGDMAMFVLHLRRAGFAADAKT